MGRTPKTRFDDHHPFHYKRYWEVYEPGKLVRQAVIARGMARTAHNLLHREVSPVPPLSYESIAGVAKRMALHYDNVFEGIDDFCFAIDEVNQSERVRPSEIDLNNLAVHSLRLQIPYIREGIIDTRRRFVV